MLKSETNYRLTIKDASRDCKELFNQVIKELIAYGVNQEHINSRMDNNNLFFTDVIQANDIHWNTGCFA